MVTFAQQQVSGKSAVRRDSGAESARRLLERNISMSEPQSLESKVAAALAFVICDEQLHLRYAGPETQHEPRAARDFTAL